MKKPILITLCCASLMLLTPLVGVAQENTVSNNLSEQPNDVDDDCDICPSIVVDYAGPDDPICVILVLLLWGFVARVDFMLLVYVILSELPFGILFKFYEILYSIRSPFLWFIGDNLLDLIDKYDCFATP